jgi:hypothetical protein
MLTTNLKDGHYTCICEVLLFSHAVLRIRIQIGIWVDHRIQVFLSILDPYQIRVADPYLICIQSGQWIRIRNPDSDPGGKK